MAGPNEFWPEDTESKMYLPVYDSDDLDMSDLIDRINQKWPGFCLNKIKIAAWHIHTKCLGYDLYDPSDYVEFIVVTRVTGGAK